MEPLGICILHGVYNVFKCALHPTRGGHLQAMFTGMTCERRKQGRNKVGCCGSPFSKDVIPSMSGIIALIIIFIVSVNISYFIKLQSPLQILESMSI